MANEKDEIIGVTETPSGPVFSVEQDARTQSQSWNEEKRMLILYYIQKFYLRKATEIDPDFRNN